MDEQTKEKKGEKKKKGKKRDRGKKRKWKSKRKRGEERRRGRGRIIMHDLFEALPAYRQKLSKQRSS